MFKYLLLLVCISLLSGCLAPKAYLEPAYRGVTYRDIQVPPKPAEVRLEVKGQVNGKDHKKACEFWRRQVVRALLASRVYEVKDGASAALTITINNVGNVGAAAGKGFVTGLTFGAVGSKVTDGYVMTVELVREDGSTFSGTYRHAIYTTIGNADGPPGLTPVTLQEAPTTVADDMVLHFLKELQDRQDSQLKPPNPSLRPAPVAVSSTAAAGRD